MDVIEFLQRQHAEIRTLFGEIESATDDKRRKELFHDLIRLLAVHEAAEEVVVHPEVRRLQGGQAVAEARIAEEHRAKELLSTLDKVGPEREGFDTLLVQLREDVLAHAEHEEREEFPLLRKELSQERLNTMGTAAQLAEKVAPTRPHPGVESATQNLLLGPPTAIMDRVRDLVRDAISR
ncbi:hemerythrin domain-containing protein [Kibdelosporangium persicum]|uniref:Hemerythrin HHE cation binding domain-containing protein n=1 Tax=Kibdelosporangium persicum TaxID=2698649 RepID=A0ABX2FIN5_9PSEU|nr:hemerythrin domain-containing protein [Kibdelosporangium persicum]NRN70575.1 Hemerythrin HHE cation binding domain-containing protein [Kibdelosporangium persicum]